MFDLNPHSARTVCTLIRVGGGDGEVSNSTKAGDKGLHWGKLLPKPKSRMKVYTVSQGVFNFAASSLDQSTLRT